MMASPNSICQNVEHFFQNLTNTCPLCFNKVFFHKSRLLRHVQALHINHSINIGEHTLLLCKLNCNDEYPTFAGHYHFPAPTCNNSNRKSDRVRLHFDQHISVPCEEINPALPDVETETRERSRCILVDSEKEIYIVSRNKTGVDVPIHVIKKTQKQPHSIRCSNMPCQESIEMAKTQGMFNFECKHLTKVKTTTLHEDPWFHNELNLSTCLSDKERTIFQKEIGRMITKGTIPVVKWIANSRYTYYSMDCCENYYSRFARVFVKYDNLQSKYYCDCRMSSKTRNCVHVVICKVYRNQKSQNVTDNECLPPNTRTTSGPSNNNKMDLTEEEVAYQLQEKKYPPSFPKACHAKSPEEFRGIKELKPKETICKLCSSVLSQDQVLTRKGVLVHANLICRNITIYYRQCPNCALRYFYKEWEDGIHVFEKTVLSLDLCMLIRNGLKNSTSVGRTVESVLEFVQSVSNDSELVSLNDARRCYTNFEVMTDHAYNFTCNICGVYPTVLMTDVCRKGFFRLPVETRGQISDEPRSMKDFWTNLSHAIILRKDLSEVIDKWSPWISPCNVLPTVQSTEAQKGKSKDVNFEDATMISQEELQEAFTSKSKKELVQYLKNDLKMDIEGKSSKDQLMSKIIEKLYFSDAFKKKLSSYAGMSVGFLTFACTHGVVYAVKALLKHESPSDYADVLLSFQHKPAIVVCDMPDHIARHLSKRDASVLRPNLGMLGAPTEENMALAKMKNLDINLPCLKKEGDAPTASNEHSYSSTREINPITRSSEVYILYDEFHKQNTSKQSECMRHAKLVPELCSINTQTSEQLNYKIGRKHYFLDRMDGKVHFFYLRLVIHLSNETIKGKNLLAKKKLFPGFVVKNDRFGRLYHSISKKRNEERDTEDENVDDSSGSDSENETNADLLLEHITLLHTSADADDLVGEQMEPADNNAHSNLDGDQLSSITRPSPTAQEKGNSAAFPSSTTAFSMEENLKTIPENKKSSTTRIPNLNDLQAPSSTGGKQQVVTEGQPPDLKKYQAATSLDNSTELHHSDAFRCDSQDLNNFQAATAHPNWPEQECAAEPSDSDCFQDAGTIAREPSSASQSSMEVRLRSTTEQGNVMLNLKDLQASRSSAEKHQEVTKSQPPDSNEYLAQSLGGNADEADNLNDFQAVTTLPKGYVANETLRCANLQTTRKLDERQKEKKVTPAINEFEVARSFAEISEEDESTDTTKTSTSKVNTLPTKPSTFDGKCVPFKKQYRFRRIEPDEVNNLSSRTPVSSAGRQSTPKEYSPASMTSIDIAASLSSPSMYFGRLPPTEQGSLRRNLSTLQEVSSDNSSTMKQKCKSTSITENSSPVRSSANKMYPKLVCAMEPLGGLPLNSSKKNQDDELPSLNIPGSSHFDEHSALPVNASGASKSQVVNLLHIAEKNFITKNYLLYEIDKMNLTLDDLRSMMPQRYMNDRTVDLSLRLLAKSHSNVQVISASVFTLYHESSPNPDMVHFSSTLQLDLTKQVILLTWCESSHWRLVALFPHEKQWTLMDPLEGTTTTVERIKSSLITDLACLTNTLWKYRVVSHSLQDDSSSCGMFIVKYCYNLCKNYSLEGLTSDQCRKELAKKLLCAGTVSQCLCAYYQRTSPVTNDDSSQDRWVQCDSCNRWIHWVCLPEELPDDHSVDFQCEICSSTQSALVVGLQSCTSFLKDLPNLPLMQTVSKGSSKPIHWIKARYRTCPNLAKRIKEVPGTPVKPLELVIIEKTKTRKCTGCKNDLITRGAFKMKNRSTIGLRKPYETTIYNTALKKTCTVDKLFFVHSSLKCLTMADPNTPCSSWNHFVIDKSVYENLMYAPNTCRRFQTEFQVSLSSIPWF